MYIGASIAVRQGAPSSCLLFIIYMDVMVRMIKDAITTDGVLGDLHALLLMDDTAVVLATSRQVCEAKLRVVMQYCQEFGMTLNIKKIPLDVDGNRICYSLHYLYLGAWFTDSGKISDVVNLHEKSNQATVNKFAIFCAANTQMPWSHIRNLSLTQHHRYYTVQNPGLLIV